MAPRYISWYRHRSLNWQKCCANPLLLLQNIRAQAFSVFEQQVVARAALPGYPEVVGNGGLHAG